MHGDVPISIAYLRGGDWRGGAILGRMRVGIHGILILIVLIINRWLSLTALLLLRLLLLRLRLLLLLLTVLPRRRHLVAVIPPGTIGGVLVALPLVHGRR